VANCAAIEKPVTGINVNLQFRLAVNETASIELRVATGDGLFLRQDANLSDLNNIAKALENLGLNLVGNWQAVQANGGKHSSGTHRIYMDWGEDGKLHITVDASDVGELFTTQNPPTASQTGAYPLAGGEVEGEVWSEVVNNYRLVTANRGTFWRFDGSTMYLMFTNEGDAHGGYNTLRPLIADFATGRLSTGHDFSVGGTLYAGAGACWMATDGNIYGPVWSGYLNQWVLAQINALNVAINNQLNSMNADRNNCVRATARGGRQHKVGGDWVGDWEAPAGCRVTGFNTNEGGDGRKMGIYYRADYYYTNASGWVQAGDIA